ncbi:RNA-binding ATPase activator esf2 [Toensbergia leucococca]|nr:RNA-binding ATPase activator esf2 [Toensbergia leucococca]
MTTRKRNKYLDLSLSDEEVQSDHDSEAAEEIKGRRSINPTSHRSKRQRQALETSDVSELEEEKTPETSPPADQPNPEDPDPPTTTLTLKPIYSATKNSLKPPKPGIIYLSRIPPFMRPQTVRHLLTPHGPITRLFLTPEPPSTYRKRISHHGNKKRSFLDGWVEFARKRDAKICAEAINGRTVGGRGWYRDDLWNVRFLRGFGWGDLMRQVEGEEREREGRMRVEVARVGRERRFFVEGVERGRVEERRRGKQRKEGTALGSVGEAVEGDLKRGERRVEVGGEIRTEVPGEGVGKGKGGISREVRRFRQNEVKGATGKQGGLVDQPSDVKRVLSKIF